jgi:TonB family protein
MDGAKTYFRMTEKTLNLSIDAPIIGIASSLAIHVCLILLVFCVPNTKLPPTADIIQLRLYSEESLSDAKSRERVGSETLNPTHANGKSGPGSSLTFSHEKTKTGVSSSAPLHEAIPPESYPAKELTQNRSESAIAEVNLGASAAGLNTEALNKNTTPSVYAFEKSNAVKSDTAENKTGSVGNQSVLETKFGTTGAPIFVRQVLPVYPPLARRLGKEGLVVLRLLIDKYGRLRDIEVMESAGFGFLEAALAGVRQSTYAPAHRNGQAVDAGAVLPIRFRLD